MESLDSSLIAAAAVVGWVLASSFAVYTLLLRKKLLAAEACFLSALNDKNDILLKNKASQQQYRENKKTLRQQEKTLETLSAKLTQTEKTLAATEKKASAQLKESELQYAALQEQAEYYQEQFATISAQIKEVDADKQANREKLKTTAKEHAQKLAQLEEAMKKKLSQAQQAHRKALKEREHHFAKEQDALQKKVHDLQEKLTHADPQELLKAQKRAKQYLGFYKMMQSQKEMLEERNRNWELALRRLSTWAIKTHSQQSYEENENLGLLVSVALQVTRLGSLVDDEFNDKENLDKAPPSEISDEISR